MNRLALVLACFLLPVAAQTPQPAAQPDTSKWERRLFQIKHVDARDVAGGLGSFGVPITPNPDLRTVSVMAPHEVMVAVEEAIKRVDVPPPPVKNIELTFHLLTGSRQSSSSGTLPRDLQSVAKQLSSVLAYQSFQLMETALIRTRDGKGGYVSGLLPSPSAGEYRIDCNTARLVPGVNAPAIRLDRLRLGLKMPTGQPVIQTDLDIREGQKVVVGKANLDTTEKALILVVTAKVVE